MEGCRRGGGGGAWGKCNKEKVRAQGEGLKQEEVLENGSWGEKKEQRELKDEIFQAASPLQSPPRRETTFPPFHVTSRKT